MLTNRNLIKDNKNTLFQKSSDVLFPINAKDKKTIENMNEYCLNSQNLKKCKKYNLTPCLGLAAPQIGVNKNIFCVIYKNSENSFIRYSMINPEIYSYSYQKSFIEDGEGCLSVDKQHNGIIPRNAWIKIKAYDYLQKKMIDETLTDFLAIIVQHEYDHLQGKLYYHRMVVPQQVLPEWTMIKRSKDEKE